MSAKNVRKQFFSTAEHRCQTLNVLDHFKYIYEITPNKVQNKRETSCL